MKFKMGCELFNLLFGFKFTITLVEPKDASRERWVMKDVNIYLLFYRFHFQWERKGPYRLRGFLDCTQPPIWLRYEKEESYQFID